MAVGNIAKVSVSNVGTTSMTISWKRPVNASKYKISVRDRSNNDKVTARTMPSLGATGDTEAYVFTGLTPLHAYEIEVIPYQGSTPGASQFYYNSNATPYNTVHMKPLPQKSQPTPPPNSKQSSSSTTNNSTTSVAPGSTSKSGSNTPSSMPDPIDMTGKANVTVPGLKLNQSYTIQIVAQLTLPDGSVIHSPYARAVVKTPVKAPATNDNGDSANFSTTNTNSDILLDGGSIFVGSFGPGVGDVDVEIDTPEGSGIILNKTGLVGLADGVKEFYIDARTGKAYFAGTVTAGTVKIGPGVDPTGTKTGLYINEQNYWYEDGTWSAKGSDIAGALTSSDYTSMPKPPAVTNVAGVWIGTDFKLTFDDDTSTAPTGYTNSYFSHFLIKLVGNSGTHTFTTPAASGLNQSFALSLSQNRAAFGVPQVAFSGSIIAVDTFGNQSAEVLFAQVAYTSPLTTPTVTVSPATGGYSVAYTSQTSAAFLNATVYEVESDSLTDPGTGYQVVAQSSANPIMYITPNYNQRWVKVRLYDSLGGYPLFSTPKAVTPLSAVGADNVGPADVSSSGLTATSGIDLSGGLGFNGYINLSWTAVSDTSLRGYRIRFTTDSGANPKYSYVDSPGNGTSYKLTSLAVGATYKIAIATYDEFNNTSTNYIAYSDVTISGTPSVSNYITAGTFQFGSGVGGDLANQGLYFNSSNYWYVNAGSSASFNLGGSTSNYLSWNGTSFIIDGDIRARKGYFAGNVEIKSGVTGGASLYSGTLYTAADQIANPANIAGSLNGAGFILNSAGLIFNNATDNGITTIDAATGRFITKNAVIGGWQIATTANTIYKNSTAGTVTLDSDNARIDIQNTSGNYHLAISAPTAGTSGTSYVAWAGAADNSAAGIEAAKFKIAQDGTVYASGAVFSGYATSGDLANYATTGSLSAYAQNVNLSNGTATISGNSIKTGVIDLNLAVVRSSATGARIELTEDGLKNYAAGNATPTVEINTDGSAYFRGDLTGNNISGAAITGGTFQTSSLVTSRRIVIDSSSPNRISFYPKTGDDATIAGYIELGDDTGSATLPGFKIKAPSASGWVETSIASTATPSGGITTIKSVILNINSLTQFSGWATNTSNVAVATSAYRNISAGTSAPSGGLTGEIYIQY